MSNGSKILNWKQITTCWYIEEANGRCVQWFKDTKLKANHNYMLALEVVKWVVSNGSKILNWKQITTIVVLHPFGIGCVQWFKDTKLKANHNRCRHQKRWYVVVSNGSKILNWKQITTHPTSTRSSQQLCPMVQRY